MQEGVDRLSFGRYVRQALSRLTDLAYLETHPLAVLLFGPHSVEKGERTRRALVDAIERLRPADTASRDSPGWRTYRQMVRRHLEDASLAEVTRELLISKRQAQRDHSMAVKAITGRLWSQYRGQAAAEPSTSPRVLPPLHAHEALHTRRAALHTELAKLGSSLPKGPSELSETLEDVLATVSGLAEARQATICTNVELGLPAVAVNRLVLRQILLNLMAYLLEVGAGACIEISAIQRPHSLELGVSVPGSSGVGGLRVPSSEAELALEVAGSLAQMQGASLRGSAESRFVLALPVAKLSTILVVDDNPDLARLFRRYLRGQPYRFVQATSGESAVSLARQHRPDLITLDVLMPAEDGWEILRRLKSEPGMQKVPIVVCSVLPDRSIALSLGVADFLPKPVTEQRLVATLQRWLPAS